MQQIEEKYLMSRRLKNCENCEWCIPTNDLPVCLLKNQAKGLFETCDMFKERTGMHISM